MATAFAAIKVALSSFGYPAVPYTYDGKEARYFTYNYAVNQGGNFGDDIPDCNVAAVQVHYFMPIRDPTTKSRLNYQDDLQTIRNSLFGHGFTYPDVAVIEEAETNKWHLVFECEYEEDIDDLTEEIENV